MKYYKDISVPTDTLIRKLIKYANTTPDIKTIEIVSHSPFIKVKQSQLQIKPYSSGEVRLRMYFDSSCGRYHQGDIIIHDGEVTEKLVFQFKLTN